MTRILVVIWLTICVYKVKLAWVIRWNIKLRLSGKKTDMRKIIISEQGGTILLLPARSFLWRNYSRCPTFIGIMTLQFSISAQFFLTLITKLSGDKILFPTNIFAQRPLIKCNLYLIEVYTCSLTSFLPGKYKDKATNWADSCFEAPISLTFKKVDMMLIFWWKKWLRSHILLISIISHLVSRQVVTIESKFEGRRWETSVINAIAYVQPQKARPDPSNDKTTLNLIIEIGEVGWVRGKKIACTILI